MVDNEENIPENNELTPEGPKNMIIIGTGGVGRTFSTEAAIRQSMEASKEVIAIGDAEKFLRSGPILVDDGLNIGNRTAHAVAAMTNDIKDIHFIEQLNIAIDKVTEGESGKEVKLGIPPGMLSEEIRQKIKDKGIIIVDDVDQYFAKERKEEIRHLYKAPPPMHEASYAFYEDGKEKKKNRACSNKKIKKRKKAKNGKSGRK